MTLAAVTSSNEKRFAGLSFEGTAARCEAFLMSRAPPCLSPWERWPSAARTEREDNGCTGKKGVKILDKLK